MEGQMHPKASSQHLNAEHYWLRKVCSHEAKIQLQAFKNNTNLATKTIFLENVPKFEGTHKKENLLLRMQSKDVSSFFAFGACIISLKQSSSTFSIPMPAIPVLHVIDTTILSS